MATELKLVKIALHQDAFLANGNSKKISGQDENGPVQKLADFQDKVRKAQAQLENGVDLNKSIQVKQNKNGTSQNSPHQDAANLQGQGGRDNKVANKDLSNRESKTRTENNLARQNEKNRLENDARSENTNQAKARRKNADNGEARADRAKAKSGSNSQNQVRDNNQNDSTEDSQSQDSKNLNIAKNQSNKNSASDAADQSKADQAEAALKERLEKMDIHASDEQLQDPAFLKAMLQFIQDITTETSNGDSGNGEIDLLGGEGTSDLTLHGIAADKNGENSSAQKMDGQGLKGLADLIQNQLENLSQNQNGQGENATGIFKMGQGSSSADAGWMQQNANGNENDQDPLANMPNADLDRLRVLQAAALQNSGDLDGESIQNDLRNENGSESNDSIADISASTSSSGAEKSLSGKNGNENSDRNGQNNPNGQDLNQALGADNNPGKNGLDNLKANALNPQFQMPKDSAHSLNGQEKALPVWAPHQGGFDQGLLQQISKKMSAMAHLSAGEISIQLEPENLGKMRVGIGMKDGQMTAHIGVESEAVRKVVENNIAQLKDQLENQGIKLQGLEVSVEQRHSSLFNPDGRNAEGFFNQQRHGSQGNNGSDLDSMGLQIAPESDTGRRLGYNTMEYIG